MAASTLPTACLTQNSGYCVGGSAGCAASGSQSSYLSSWSPRACVASGASIYSQTACLWPWSPRACAASEAFLYPQNSCLLLWSPRTRAAPKAFLRSQNSHRTCQRGLRAPARLLEYRHHRRRCLRGFRYLSPFATGTLEPLCLSPASGPALHTQNSRLCAVAARGALNPLYTHRSRACRREEAARSSTGTQRQHGVSWVVYIMNCLAL